MTFINLTVQAMEDSKGLAQAFVCTFWAVGLALRPPTFEEATAGRQVYQHEDHEHTISILWRAEQERAEADALREVEMAACPYHSCTCGHHE